MGGGTETTKTTMPAQQKQMYQGLANYLQWYIGTEGEKWGMQRGMYQDIMPYMNRYYQNLIPQMTEQANTLMPLMNQYYQAALPAQTQYIKEMAPLTLAAERAKTAYSLPMYQQTYNRMMGYTTPEQMNATQTSLQQLKEQAGTMGVAPGSPQLLEQQRKLLESTTKPDPNIMQTAMSLFGPSATQYSQPNIPYSLPNLPSSQAGMPSIPEMGGTQTTTSQPGFMGTLTGIGSAGMGLGASAYGIAQLLPLLGLSSREFKENISKLKSKDYTSALNKVRKTDVNTYRYKGDGASHIGVIAEESPDEITTSNKKMINIPDYLGLLLAATKALDKKLIRMEKRNA